MESYYDFMFFSTVWFSFKCLLQKLDYSPPPPLPSPKKKKSWQFVRLPQNSGNFVKPPKIAQKPVNAKKLSIYSCNHIDRFQKASNLS